MDFIIKDLEDEKKNTQKCSDDVNCRMNFLIQNQTQEKNEFKEQKDKEILSIINDLNKICLDKVEQNLDIEIGIEKHNIDPSKEIINKCREIINFTDDKDKQIQMLMESQKRNVKSFEDQINAIELEIFDLSSLKLQQSLGNNLFDSNLLGFEKAHGEEICSICCLEFKQDCEKKRLDCQHTYHESCIAKWLQRKKACPVCKFLTPKSSLLDSNLIKTHK